MSDPNMTPPTPAAVPQTPPAPPTPAASQNESIKLMAALSYLGILVLIPIFTHKDNPFVKFHIKQGLLLLIIEIIFSLLGRYLFVIFFLLNPLIGLAILVLIVMGILNVVNGEQKKLPVIGSYAEKIFKF
jgi:uncharacterized membrane protein